MLVVALLGIPCRATPAWLAGQIGWRWAEALGCGATKEQARNWAAWFFCRASVRMTRITTRQIRRRRSKHIDETPIEYTYVDGPASLETWVDHCTALAAEFGISALDVHRALFAQFPEIFGQ